MTLPFALLFLLGLQASHVGTPKPPPCDPSTLRAAFTDTTTGQEARAFPLPIPRSLVAIYPFGPTWAGFLLLTTCEAKVLDTLYTGGVDTVVIQHVTPRDRPEALVYAVPATGSGGRTSVLSIVTVQGDSFHVLWAQPYLDYFIAREGGGKDTASVTFPAPGHLVYRGTSQPFHLDSLGDSVVADGPPCLFVEHWLWRAAADTFAVQPGGRPRKRCKAA